jgi:hypothetical protein
MYYYDTILGLDFEWSFFIDVRDVKERNREVAPHAKRASCKSANEDWVGDPHTD